MRFRPAALRRKLCIAVSAPFLAAAAYADDLALDMPPQELGASLNQLARQANVQILFAADAVKGKRAPALNGSYAPEAALRALLTGSGLEIKANGDGTFAVRPAQPGRSPQSRENQLADVVITATRTTRRADEVPASVSVLTRKDLATKNRQNVYDALRDVESLDFVTQPGLAHQDIPSIRGVRTSVGATVQPLVDGMATDSIVSAIPGRGGLNFTALHDVERVEVVRGPASALYGPSAVGGVINVIPRRWTGAPGVEVGASYGSHDTQTYAIAAGMAEEKFDIRVSAYDARSDGFVSVPSPGSPVLGYNGKLSGFDLAGRGWKDHKLGVMTGFRPADDHEIALAYRQYATRSAGLFGGRPHETSDQDGESTTLGYRYELSAETHFRMDYRSTKLKQRYGWDKWDYSGTANNLDLAAFGGRNSDSTAFQAIVDTRPFSGNQLILGVGSDRGEFTQFTTVVGGSTTVIGSRSEVNSFFIQDEQRLGAFSFMIGDRHDRINLSPDTRNGLPTNGKASVESVRSPRAGARYHLNPATSFYAAVGEAYVPALNSYKFPLAPKVDNPGLKPETSRTEEIGMNNRLPFGTLRTSLYHTDYKDKITSFVVGPAANRTQWRNIAKVEIDGLEIAFQGDLGHGWRPYANWSVTKARDFTTDAAPGTQSLRVAPHKFNAGLTYAPGDIWSATLNVRYVSGLYFNSITQAQWADGYTIADMRMSTKLPFQGQKWEAFFAVNNLTDNKYEPFNKGEESDGRTVMIGLNGKF